MPAAATGFEEPPMTEPMLGLAVAIGIAIYLIYTLLYPEKF